MTNQLTAWRAQVAEWDASLLNMERFAKPLREACDRIQALEAANSAFRELSLKEHRESADRIAALEAEHKGCDYALRQSEQIRKDVEADLKIAEAERWKCSLNWHNVSAALSETIKKNEALEARLAAAEARLKAAEAVCFYVERSYRMCEEGDIMGGGNAYQDALTALAAWRLAKGGET